MIDKRLPMFKLASNIFDAFDMEDINNTAKDMGELGIFIPPFRSFIVSVKTVFVGHLMRIFFDVETGNVISNVNGEFAFEYHYHPSTDEIEQVFYMSRKNGMLMPPESFGLDMSENSESMQYFSFLGNKVLILLIVLLATKNISKETQTCNKPNSRNRRERSLSKYSSVTTISIGRITETMRSFGSGSPVRPHLRRGHIRHQHYGKGNAEVKKIFIQPVFVNADQGWIDSQKEYRVVA